MHFPWCALFTTAALCSPLKTTALAVEVPGPALQQHRQEEGGLNGGKEGLRNANHVFNAIHSSLRQWGSSVNHNGMSYFLATVPEGIQFYHGRSSKEPVEGMEWLAFEPEHALVFARPMGPPGGPGGRRGRKGKDRGKGKNGPPMPPHGLESEDGPPAMREPPEGGDDETPFPGPLPPSGLPRGRKEHHDGPPHPPHGPPKDMDERHDVPPPPPPHGPPKDMDAKPGMPPPPPHGPPKDMNDRHGMHAPPPPPPHGSTGDMRGPKGMHAPPPPPPHGWPADMDERHGAHPPPPPPPPHGHFDQDEHPPHHPPHGPSEDRGERHGARPPPPHRPQQEERVPFPSLPDDSDPRHVISESFDKARSRWMKITNNPEQQEPISKVEPKPKEDEDERSGYLHTYKTAHPLSLLYIDGMSAAKTEKGTLDSTDSVLVDIEAAGDVMHNENERAMQLCNRSRDEWGGRIDGFLRMEMGFEIILCDFEKDLIVERVTQVKQQDRSGKGGKGKGGPGGFGGNGEFAYYQAVAARFDGIGGDRVGLDYDNFVSAFTYPADLFQGGAMPRLQNVSNETTTQIRNDITELVLSHAPADVAALTNWQSVADMVVARYSARLRYLALGEIESLDAFREVIGHLLRPFIDYSARNSSLEVSRCAAQFMPHGHRPCLAADAIFTVATRICSTLSQAADEDSYAVATAGIQSLNDWLQWTSWKRCSGCDDDEVCFIPIWPTGRTQDYVHPTCQKSIPRVHEDSYWGGWGRPPMRGNGSDDGYYPYPPPPPPGAWDGDEERPMGPEEGDEL